MESMILKKGYIAVALIKFKYEVFNENFITISELKKFIDFMQEEINKRNLCITITNDNLYSTNFKLVGDIITIENPKCCFDLYTLPCEIYDLLTNKTLIIEFIRILENEKLAILENLNIKLIREQMIRNLALSAN